MPKDNKESPSRIETKTAYVEAAGETLPATGGLLDPPCETPMRPLDVTALLPRRHSTRLVTVLGAIAALFVAGCGGGGSSSPPPPPPPPPPPASAAITFIDPIVTTQSSGTLALTVNGSAFTSTSQVFLNGSAKTTSFLNSTKLTAQILSSDISSPGAFPVTVHDGTTVSNSVNFFVVPSISARTVSVAAGATKTGINLDVPALSTTLSLIAVGNGSVAGATGVCLAPGGSADLFIVGLGVTPGTFYSISGNPADVTVKQPLASAFTRATGSLPAVNVSVTVNSTAAVGPRNIIVINPGGEISVFVGGLLISQSCP